MWVQDLSHVRSTIDCGRQRRRRRKKRKGRASQKSPEQQQEQGHKEEEEEEGREGSVGSKRAPLHGRRKPSARNPQPLPASPDLSVPDSRIRLRRDSEASSSSGKARPELPRVAGGLEAGLPVRRPPEPWRAQHGAQSPHSPL